MTEFLNVPSYNVGQGPVTFGDFTSAPGTPPASLGAAISNPMKMGSTLSTNEKIVLALGLATSIGAGVAAFKVKSNRRSMSAVAFTALPLALVYAGMNN
jgi:hypothetical protein